MATRLTSSCHLDGRLGKESLDMRCSFYVGCRAVSAGMWFYELRPYINSRGLQNCGPIITYKSKSCRDKECGVARGWGTDTFRSISPPSSCHILGQLLIDH